MALTTAAASVIGSGISAASAVGTGISNSVKNKKSYKWTKELYEHQNRFNAEQAQIAYDRQRDFYDYSFNKEFENEKFWADYNSPMKQVQRMKQAGLNPALLTSQLSSGEMSTSAAGQSSSPQASAAGVGQFQSQGVFNGINMADTISLLSLLSQTELNDSVVKKNEAEVNKTGQEIEESKTRQKNIDADTELKGTQKEHVKASIRETLFNFEHMLPADLKKRFAEINQINNDIQQSQTLTRAQVAKFSQEIKESVSRINLNKKQGLKIDAEIDNMNKRLEKDLQLSEQQFQHLKVQTHLQQSKNDIFDQIMNADGWKIEPLLLKLRLLEKINSFAF